MNSRAAQRTCHLVDYRHFLWYRDPLAKEATPDATGRLEVHSFLKTLRKLSHHAHHHPCLLKRQCSMQEWLRICVPVLPHVSCGTTLGKIVALSFGLIREKEIIPSS